MPQYDVICADFRETLAAVEGQAALIATSPPYPDARTCYGSLEWKDYQALGDAVLGALQPGGHCLLNLSAPVRQLREGHGTERDPLPFRVFLDWYDRIGLTAPDVLAFGRDSLPGSFPQRFKSGWEPLLWFVKPGRAWKLWPGRLQTKGVKRAADRHLITKTMPDGSRVRMNTARSGKASRSTLWSYGAVGFNLTGCPDLEAQNHPARWPYRLAADIVACFSDVGDLVVDPFLGGGTTLCAACDGGRRFLGGDLSEEWAEKSRQLAARRYSQLSIASTALEVDVATP